MKRVYVAGPYSCDKLIGALDNMRKGMRASKLVLDMGHAPFVPWFDFHFSLIAETTLEQYQTYSMAWLDVSDCVYALPGWKDSKGTLMEIDRAKELGIPIYYSLHDLEEAYKK